MSLRVLLLSSLLIINCYSLLAQNNPTPPPNIVWITSEDNSMHYLKLFNENGVATPNIESLADHGLLFTHAFSNAPVCSVARSTIISGSYAPRIGSQFHRKSKTVPLPDSLRMFPFYLRRAGYHTSNNNKKDYNIIEGEEVWDESSREASWKSRKPDQPFFHVFNIGVSHESSLHFSEEKMKTTPTKTDLSSFSIQPNHPDTELFRYTNSYYRDKIIEMDQRVGEVIRELENDGLLENTFIFYFGDHGGVLPGSKGYLYETGLHVPMVVHVPEKYKNLAQIGEQGKVNGFVSFIDLGPTVLQLAGIKTPDGMDGMPFLGADVTKEMIASRNTSFSYADRFDEKYDMVRAIRKGKYKYIRNYQSFNFDGMMNNYRYIQLAYQEWEELYKKGALNEVQAAFFKPKEVEMLFDVESDPYETVNLISDPTYRKIVEDLRMELNNWLQEMPDLSFYPEHVLIDQAFSNPTDFGIAHQKDIQRYIEIANWSILPFEKVENFLKTSLMSKDPWERYWGLITSSNFGPEAKNLSPLISEISKEDEELINRVRAAEFLAISNQTDPSQVMVESLYQSKKPMEALLILNSIVLLNSFEYGYEIILDTSKITSAVIQDSEVKRRLAYLKGD
ncbi:sulfatase family protein [Algoriphagus halophilus]|uniref:Arylsulfatase A n=1 Tax=Algoriphagus halophilus TaxID=226505 RepID=A0A1N6G5D1_9BACT|nr:sulfatase [Algoriphagus halophilus]SIO02728.1 Arylsulfatase A [Algoriphagus halophilus]